MSKLKKIPIVSKKINDLEKTIGILQLEKGKLEADMRKQAHNAKHPKAPYPPSNPEKFVPSTIKKNGEVYRMFLTDKIRGKTKPRIKGLPKKEDYLQVGLGREGTGKFGPKWTVVDLFDPSPYVDYNYDVQNMPKNWSNRYSLALCNAILEHIPYPQKAVHELYRVLAPGGFVYIEIPFLQQYHTGGDSTIGDVYEFGGDYWRATVDGLRVWASDFEEISAGWQNEGGVYFFGRKPLK